MNKSQEIEQTYAKNKEKWLEMNNFSAEGVTYIVTGETYSIKDQLKVDGFYYHPILGWHKATCEGYEDKVIAIKAEEVIEWAAWGAGWFLPSAKDYIKDKIAATQSKDTSDWIGEVGKSIPILLVKLDKAGSFQGRYGLSNIYTFVDEDNNKLVWFTTTRLNKEVGDWFCISAKVKAHETYQDRKQTIVKNVKIYEED